ncbi:MAG TPA: methylated-DNA--[protein]-cysteine S-methyltransferase [Chloroflexota bacterium]|jgi:methylated-DNA-[protein]-cysteine S-methyltransferase
MCAALWTQKLREGLPGSVAAAPSAGGTAPRALADGRAAPAPSGGALAYSSCASPFGTVRLAATVDGICAVSLYETEAAFRGRLAAARGDALDAAPLLAQAATELAEYFAGRRQGFGVPLDLTAATPFDRRVLAAIAAIPYGTTRTYGELARALGSPGAARAVGHACGRNPVPLLIACHRVLRSDGSLAGFGAGGPTVKADSVPKSCWWER